MAKADPSSLVAVATELDAELATYARLGDLLLRSSLGSVKQLERAKATLDELAQSEQRLQETAQRLIGALGVARERQQQLATAVVAHAPVLTSRTEQLNALVAAMHGVAAEAGALNEDLRGRDPAAIADQVLALCAKVEKIAADARAAEFAELGDQAHALYQRLRAAGKKLQR